MKKYFLAAVLTVTIVLPAAAQIAESDSTNNTLIAINSEQLLEKAGFENLMKMAFDEKAMPKKQTAEDAAKKATLRKALAAIYGAGINFNKKAWFVSKTKLLGLSAYLYSYEGYETPLRLFIFPVANRQVMEQNIITVLNTQKPQEEEAAVFIKSGNIAYLQSKKTLLVLTDDELVVATLPEKMNTYNNDLYNGKTIKRDTTITPKTPEETIEEVKKTKNSYEIDRLLPNGKIKRVFTYKKEKPVIFTAPVTAADTVMASVTAIDTVVSVSGVADAAVPVSDSITVQDTLTRTEYINDSTYVTVYYLPYSEDERTAIEKQNEEEKQLRHQQAIALFLNNYKTYLPYNTNSTIVQQLTAATADITIYGNAGSYMPGGAAAMLFGAGRFGQFQQQRSPGLTSITFNNGEVMVINANNCCSTAAPLYGKFYEPITAFWPAVLGNPALGNMQFNVNIPQMLAHLKQNNAQVNKMQAEMKKEGLELDKIQDMFSGEAAIAINAGLSARGKKQPRLLIALKIKNAAAAVNFMNKMGSENTKFTKSYRFDENAQYLLIDTDGKNGLTKPAVAGAAKFTTPQNSYGYFMLNVKAMVASLTKDSKKNNADYKKAIQFYGKAEFMNTKDAEGKLTASIRIDMGDKKSNALFNLVGLMEENTNSRLRLLPPLSGLK